MRIFSTLAGLSCLTLLSTALPQPLFDKQEFISCSPMYTGGLVLLHKLESLDSYYSSIPSQVPANINQGYIYASVSRQARALKVQFDACTLTGWNVKGVIYGQIRLQEEMSDCLTIKHPYEPKSDIVIRTCERQQAGELQGQWFRTYKELLQTFFEPTVNPHNNQSIARKGMHFNSQRNDYVSAEAQSDLLYTQLVLHNVKAI